MARVLTTTSRSRTSSRKSKSVFPSSTTTWNTLNTRNPRPISWTAYCRNCARKTRKTWLQLQKYPQFKPLNQTAASAKATEKHLGPEHCRDCYPGNGQLRRRLVSVEKWLENGQRHDEARSLWSLCSRARQQSQHFTRHQKANVF